MPASPAKVAAEERRRKLHLFHDHGVPEHVSSALAQWEQFRAAPWDSYLTSDCPGSAHCGDIGQKRDTSKVQLGGLVHGGIPRVYRPAMWRAFLDLDSKMVPGDYAELWCRVLVAYAPPEAIIKAQREAEGGLDDSMESADDIYELEVSFSEDELDFCTPRGSQCSETSMDSDIPERSAAHLAVERSWSSQFWHDVSLGSPNSSLDSPELVDRIRDKTQRRSPLGDDAAVDVNSPHSPPPSGAETAMRRHRQDWVMAIERDLDRTFPDHLLMQDQANQYAVFRMLAAFSEKNPAIGYCQGMNVLACIALIVMHDEEEAFWCLAAMVEGLFSDYFTGVGDSVRMDPVESDCKVLEALVAQFHPQLAEHFEFLGVSVRCLATPWFLSAFSTVLPLEPVLRLWDLMFFERNTSVLFRAALAMFDLFSQDILSCENPADVYLQIKGVGETLYDANELIIIASTKYSGVDLGLVQEKREAVLSNVGVGGATAVNARGNLIQYFICSNLCG